MFTDGLVERRGTPLDERLALLETSLRASPSIEPGPVADFVIDAMTADEQELRRHRGAHGLPAGVRRRSLLTRRPDAGCDRARPDTAGRPHFVL